jgi:hypothetical protein
LAKIGLAAELAKQAAQAAREEMAASEPQAKAATKPAAAGWSVPVLPVDFQLDAALTRATKQVASHYRNVLATEGLDVGIEPAETKAAATNGADLPQAAAPLQASLREQQTGRLVRSYTAPALLSLFATQQQSNGLVVDGQV